MALQLGGSLDADLGDSPVRLLPDHRSHSVQKKDSSQPSSRAQDVLPCHPAFAESLEKPPGLGEGHGLRRGRVYLAPADLSEDVGEQITAGVGASASARPVPPVDTDDAAVAQQDDIHGQSRDLAGGEPEHAEPGRPR